MAVGAYNRNSRKARKRARKLREKLGPSYFGAKHGYLDRRTGRHAGNVERGELRDALAALHEYLHARFADVPGIVRAVMGRYHPVYVSHTPGYGTDGERWGFAMIPRGGRYWSDRWKPTESLTEAINDRSRWLASYATHGEVFKVYPRPPREVPRVLRNVGWAYRGMSWEEYATAMQRGWFASQGAYNIPGQGESVTFFSKDPDTAIHYAQSFQAWAFHATPTRPGVVIAVPRNDLVDYLGGIGLTEEQRAHVRQQIKRNPHVNEMVRWGKLPVDRVRAAWLTYPTVFRAGFVEAAHRTVPRRDEYGRITWVQVWDEGQRHGFDGSRYVIVPIEEFDTGLGGLR